MVFPVVVLVFDLNESSEEVLHGHSLSHTILKGISKPLYESKDGVEFAMIETIF
jgi:hypothetical protein